MILRVFGYLIFYIWLFNILYSEIESAYNQQYEDQFKYLVFIFILWIFLWIKLHEFQNIVSFLFQFKSYIIEKRQIKRSKGFGRISERFRNMSNGKENLLQFTPQLRWLCNNKPKFSRKCFEIAVILFLYISI